MWKKVGGYTHTQKKKAGKRQLYQHNVLLTHLLLVPVSHELLPSQKEKVIKLEDHSDKDTEIQKKKVTRVLKIIQT